MGLWSLRNPYPQPRRRAAASASPDTGAGPAPIPPPRSRVWSVQMTEQAANSTTRRVSGRLRGPAIIKAVSYDYSFVNPGTALAGGWGLRWATDDSGEGRTAGAVVLPGGSAIIEQDYSLDSGGSSQANELHRDMITATANKANSHPLNYLISAPEFFLKAYLVHGNVAGTEQVSLLITILESVDPELIPDLLG